MANNQLFIQLFLEHKIKKQQKVFIVLEWIQENIYIGQWVGTPRPREAPEPERRS